MEKIALLSIALLLSAIWMLRFSVMLSARLSHHELSVIPLINKIIVVLTALLIFIDVIFLNYQVDHIVLYLLSLCILLLKVPRFLMVSMLCSLMYALISFLMIVFIHTQSMGWVWVHSTMASVTLYLTMVWVLHAMMFISQDASLKSISYQKYSYPSIQYSTQVMIILSWVTGVWMMLVLFSGGMLTQSNYGWYWVLFGLTCSLLMMSLFGYFSYQSRLKIRLQVMVYVG